MMPKVSQQDFPSYFKNDNLHVRPRCMLVTFTVVEAILSVMVWATMAHLDFNMFTPGNNPPVPPHLEIINGM